MMYHDWPVSSSTAIVPSGRSQCSSVLAALALAAPPADPPTGFLLPPTAMSEQPQTNSDELTASASRTGFIESILMTTPCVERLDAHRQARTSLFPFVETDRQGFANAHSPVPASAISTNQMNGWLLDTDNRHSAGCHADCKVSGNGPRVPLETWHARIQGFPEIGRASC